MLKITRYKTIDKDKDKYLSFPDIIKSPIKKDRLFLIHREGNSHHPTWSKLILQISNNNQNTVRNAAIRGQMKLGNIALFCNSISILNTNIGTIKINLKNTSKSRIGVSKFNFDLNTVIFPPKY